MRMEAAWSETHWGSFIPDPEECPQTHASQRGMIERSLQEVGAARSIVIDEEGRILAGNATVEAAALAGIENVQVVEADGETIIAVRRSGLTEEQKRRLALYDNRTAELAEWDVDVLAELDEEALEGLFDGDELAALLGDLPDPGSALVEDVPEIWAIVVECDDEQQQVELLERFAAEGLRCRAFA